MSDSLIDLAWLVYLIDVFATEDYNAGVGTSLVLGCIGWLLTIIVPDKEWDEGVKPQFTKASKFIVTVGLVYSIYFILAPSKETAWTITGIVMTAKAVDNPSIQNITSEGMDILEKKLKMYSKELDKQMNLIEGDDK